MNSALPQSIDLSTPPTVMPPPGVRPNFANPTTLAESIIAISTTTSVLAITLLFTRLYSTLRVTRSVGYDDYACVIAMIFSLVYMSLIINIRDYSRHMWDIQITGLTSGYFKIILSETIIRALGLLFAKLSILVLLLRLFSPNRRFRYAIYVGIVWTTLVSLTTVIVAGALCAPRKGEAFDGMKFAQRCGHSQIWATVQGALNVVLDFYILYLPIPVVWKLQLERNRKIGVLGIFATGLIACVSSVLSVFYKARLLQNPDTLWNSYIVFILNIVETNVGIMVASMPACASYLRHVLSHPSFLSIKSRLASSRSKKYPRSKSTTDTIGLADDKTSENHHLTAGSGGPGKGSKGMYWRLKNGFGKEAPPQITAAKRESGQILKSVDFNMFSTKSSSFEQEEKTVANDVV